MGLRDKLDKVRDNLNRDVKGVFPLDQDTQQARLETRRQDFLDQLARLATESRISYDAVHLAAVMLLAGDNRIQAAAAVADQLGGVISGVNPHFGLDQVLTRVERMVSADGEVWANYQEKLPFQPPVGYQDTPPLANDFPPAWRG